DIASEVHARVDDEITTSEAQRPDADGEIGARAHPGVAGLGEARAAQRAAPDHFVKSATWQSRETIAGVEGDLYGAVVDTDAVRQTVAGQVDQHWRAAAAVFACADQVH